MRNFNTVMATAADLVIAETEYVVPVGDIEPENMHTYGICVDYIVEGEKK
jgi:acetate CoA/acetoacetate CoA-transferase alpha subunit